MNLHLAPLALAAAALLAAPSRAGADEPWFEDFDAASAAAKAAGKDLLVAFVGSDWCGWCARLDREVFGKEAFTRAVQDDYVLLALDYPREEPALSRVPSRARNAELREKYAVPGFPTVLLMSADGVVYATTGYRQGGVRPWLAYLQQLRVTKRAPFVAARLVGREFAKASDERKLEIFEQVCPVLSVIESSSDYAPLIVPAVRWAIATDPKGERGLRERAYRALLWSGQARRLELATAREIDPGNDEGLLELVVRAHFLVVEDSNAATAAVAELNELAPYGFRDRQVGFELYFTAAQWFGGPLGDAELRVVYATRAKKIGTDEVTFLEELEKLLRK